MHAVLQAEHVRANEGGCLSYQLSTGEEDPHKIVIFERRVDPCFLFPDRSIILTMTVLKCCRGGYLRPFPHARRVWLP